MDSEKKQYQELTQRMMPKRPILRNVLWAFFVGGIISEVGQCVQWFFMHQAHLSAKAAGAPTSVVMIGVGALLTGLGWYDRVVKRGGMGGSLPITGFANAMVAPAMEYKTEGLVMGIGARLFTVAGPVLVYGMAAAFVVSGIRYLITGVA
ncbi:stage V sporulation protein AC [Sulfobacillus harzensis]|uniref:Stage V sporulation protein AC n=1 Tax=Sulfobacillus harzensis TaxID=2729629 RepID=A0A7Y0Q1T1_9FIRM|nr:stage V sporulation protein AC [Sulfobacillus harzensis]NMP22428.1 stage V sporulation protein AC [Sulfobacillus harzensis]